MTKKVAMETSPDAPLSPVTLRVLALKRAAPAKATLPLKPTSPKRRAFHSDPSSSPAPSNKKCRSASPDPAPSLADETGNMSMRIENETKQKEEAKLDATRRKLHDSYKKFDEKKDARKIQVLKVPPPPMKHSKSKKSPSKITKKKGKKT